MTDIEKVKKDLRELKRNTHMISKLQGLEQAHRSRIELITRLGKEKELSEHIKAEEKLIKGLDIGKYIREAQLVEEKYMNAINTLSPTDKAMIIDSYMNGRPYWQIGVEMGYTEEGVRKRIGKIIKEIAKKYQSD